MIKPIRSVVTLKVLNATNLLNIENFGEQD